MANHPYKYKDRVLKQSEGGSIGSILTCVLAKTRMLLNTRKLKNRLEYLSTRWFMDRQSTLRSGKTVIQTGIQQKHREIKLAMIKVYVDDEFILASRIGPGWRYDSVKKRMIHRREFEIEDVGVPCDQLTARVITNISNDLDSDIKMTFDCPSLNPDKKMPVLDLKAWLKVDENGRNKILTQFYKKEVSSKICIKKDSALSWTCKKAALSGEVFRRLYNCSHEIRDTEGPALIRSFCNDLLNSGYNKLERDVIVGEGLARLCNLKKQVEDGLRPMYRTAEWQQHERIIGKKLKRKSWYGANVESVVFCQATPNEILRKSLQEEVKKSGLNIRVVEKGGRNVKSLLQRSDVKPEISCNDPSCVVCLTSSRGQCRVENSGYSITCLQCEENGVTATYQGETGRCAKVRCGEHARDLRNKAPRSNLYDHVVERHAGDLNTKFKYEVVRVFHNDVLARQLEEGMRIENQQGISMNSQQEWNAPAVVQVSAYRMHRH